MYGKDLVRRSQQSEYSPCSSNLLVICSLAFGRGGVDQGLFLVIFHPLHQPFSKIPYSQNVYSSCFPNFQLSSPLLWSEIMPSLTPTPFTFHLSPSFHKGSANLFLYLLLSRHLTAFHSVLAHHLYDQSKLSECIGKKEFSVINLYHLVSCCDFPKPQIVWSLSRCFLSANL